MVGKKNIRSYEVSIWTLQDSFITVLKPLNLEHKGAIQNGKITLQDDGENRISFSIPMYIREKGKFIENPLWHNTEDGNLIANLRKLKVIFNKRTVDERVFEFIITKVTENHEGFEKTCEVEGEGLAFNELGKQGYKISLSEEDLYNEVSDKLDALKADDSTDGISVKNNINYWVDKVLAGTNWNYSIQMDWTAVDGIIDQYEEGATRYSDLSESQRETLNTNRAVNGLRRHDRVYEDSYVSSWSISNNTLVPAAIVASMEKLRMVDGSESNRYNLLQSIAEAFEVYTKYKYYYDKNYHIIRREVIFYNNFLDEDNTIDLTYDYDTQSISRELDAADIVTKMYVKTLDEETYPSGLASIMDTEANKTGEDYILNFDYLYDIKTISEEQYAAIKVFEKNIANLNKQIKPLDTSIIKLEAELLDAEVARDNALALTKEAEENINFITEQLKAITNDSNYNTTVVVVKENPAFIFLSKQGNNYLGKFGSQFSGIVPGTVKVYSNQACTSAVSFTQQIKNNMVQSLTFTNSIGANTTSGYLYATFSYKPALEKEKLRDNYISLRNNNQTIYNNNLKIINGTNPTKVNGTKKELGLTNYIQAQKQKRKSLYEQKQALIADFENMMGPALREGNWQPEDEYVGYGDQYDENLQPSYSSAAISTTSGKLKFIWDKELFDEEEKNYYEYGINQEKVYYPCINLTAINSNIFEKLKEEDFRNGLSFVYKNSGESNPYLLPQGVNCKFAFIQLTSGGNIIPVLMITNLYNETNITNDTTASTALTYLKSLTSYITYTTDISILLNTITANNSTIFSVPSSAWITQPHKYNIVYPRLEIQSDLLKTGANELLLNIYREKANPTGQGTVYTYIDKLEEFTDYSLFSRNEKKYITIKPEVLLAGKIGEAKIKINYCLANTALQIYLDAIEVMKENAYPKVSYTINQLFSPKLFYNTYDRLGQLAHINDAKLKFKNVMGYISAVELDLDKPWEDSITIQNYKNKFEDLFSTIVAQTEDMKKNAYRINAAANAFSANGLLTAEVTPESLLKSARVLNNLIKRNADVIAAKATSEAAKNKAALASTDAYRIMHGEVGLAFKGNQIDSVVLNQDKGLIIAGTTGSGSSKKSVFFRLDNAEMGFFQGTSDNLANATPQLHYENGNLALSGVIYAANGWFGDERGWIIGSGLTNSNSGKLVYKNSSGTNVTTTISDDDLGGLLYSANGKAIFTSGSNSTNPKIILSKNGFPNITTDNGKNDALFLFDGTNLYINGTITSTAGNIGGWHIGSSYLGNNTTQLNSTVGMASGKDSSEQSQKYSFWAGGAYSGTPLFYVTPAGYLYSTSGKIANWEISNYQLNSGSGTTYVALNSGASNVTGGSTYAIWAGNTAAASAPFSVTKAGVLKATGATINGNTSITANNVNITGNTNSSFTVDMTNFKVADNGDVTVTGQINASSGSITGGLTVSGYFTTNASRKTYNDTSNKGITISSSGIGGYGDNGSFTMTTGGKLTATGADITGAIKATSGTIGQPSAPKISIGSTSDASTSPSWIYSGSKTAYDSPNNGFYIGTNGIALGGYNATSKHSPFEITTSGALYATSGEIGGWTIGEKRLFNKRTITENNASANYFAGLKTDGECVLAVGANSEDDTSWSSAPFTVSKKGKLTATGADITGAIKADTGYIGGSSGWTIKTQAIYNGPTTLGAKTAGLYLGIDGISGYSDSTHYFTFTKGTISATGATISGALTATTLATGNRTSNSTGTAGTFIDSTGAIYVGNTNAFTVTAAGKVTATGVDISGKITAKDGSIAGWTIGDGYITTNSSRTSYNASSKGMTMTVSGIGAWNDTNNYFTLSAAGGLIAKGANITGALTATSLTVGDSNTMTYNSNGLQIGSGDNYLKYNSSGLVIKGDITATSGTFTGTINANGGKIGSTAANQIILADGVIRWNRTKTDDTEDKTGFYLSKSGLFIGNKNKFKVTAAGAVTASDITIKGGSLNINDAFKVSSNGEMTATKGNIGGSNGWVIQPGIIYSASLNPSSTTQGTGIALSSDGTNSQLYMMKNDNLIININTQDSSDEIALFYVGQGTNYLSYTNKNKIYLNGTNTSITGATIVSAKINSATINSAIITSARIGNGWYIGEGDPLNGNTFYSSFIANDTRVSYATIGLYCATESADTVFWAGGPINGGSDGRNPPKFYVRRDGYLNSTLGKIGGWDIGKNYIKSSGLTYYDGLDDEQGERFAGSGLVLSETFGSTKMTGLGVLYKKDGITRELFTVGYNSSGAFFSMNTGDSTLSGLSVVNNTSFTVAVKNTISLSSNKNLILKGDTICFQENAGSGDEELYRLAYTNNNAPSSFGAAHRIVWIKKTTTTATLGNKTWYKCEIYTREEE